MSLFLYWRSKAVSNSREYATSFVQRERRRTALSALERFLYIDVYGVQKITAFGFPYIAPNFVMVFVDFNPCRKPQNAYNIRVIRQDL